MQGSLFPIELIHEEPADTGTAMLKLIGHDTQGHKYALKTLQDHPSLPLTEWVCYGLCALANVPTPDYAIVVRINGDLAFGSRWATDAEQIDPGKRNHAEILSMFGRAKESMGGALAVDAALPNPDRHLRNFLFRTNGARIIALAYDWSEVSSLHPPVFSGWPWQTGCNSDKMLQTLRYMRIFDNDKAASTLDRIKEIPVSKVRSLLSAAPAAWKTPGQEQAILDWWSANIARRINQTSQIISQ